MYLSVHWYLQYFLPFLQGEGECRLSQRCAICSYHGKEDEEYIRHTLEAHGFTTDTSKGYMCPNWTIEAYLEAELRRGIVFGRKEE